MPAREQLILPNGLQIWMEPLAYMHTASFGFWIASGSALETPAENGISHFLEHMFFKGSNHRTAHQIAAEMDAIGGVMNAYTTKEYTCFYARTLTEHVAEGFDILADMLAYPLLKGQDVQLERGVILEEINMSMDDPEDFVCEQLTMNIWKNSPYGQPILGSRENILAVTADQLRSYFLTHYSPHRMAIAITGNFDRDSFVAQVQRYFGQTLSNTGTAVFPPVSYQRCAVITPRDELEQTHLCLALPALPLYHPKRYALSILTMALGSSSSSRLFQRIREELGLVYSIAADSVSYSGSGLLEIYAAVSPNELHRAVEEILSVLQKTRKGITKEEFSRCKEGLKSSFLMGMENSMTRTSYLGRNALYHKVLDDETLMTHFDSVTYEEVNLLAQTLLDIEKISISVVGPAPDSAALRAYGGEG